jgi:seryl-tRNA synthetase
VTYAKTKAKEPADDLIAEKTQLDEEKSRIEKIAFDAREVLLATAASVGNLVGKDVPVSLTEVITFLLHSTRLANGMTQDDNVTLRTWHPDGPNEQVEQRNDILPHHEVMIRLDAFDMERGPSSPVLLF